ncbi:hypothetical protein KTE28_18410 [Burkholderia multivorans]|uniref:hypothetical protein n=1 Tax=Burkholderia multivorans TaxID=87883 RepID=UPI00158F2A02|nr:hypothetical protein [Burkholderia multivorans]MBU9144935.1 hypothetical protein [Burkholderia multivorans]MBU9376302.1 hypothetical protein [Burkholderia multivorans]MBU9528233.1 hypothetical protein [Burkholderia multivorans]MBU9540048.1 hypothetical protein [Burkholderia multivorans]MDI3300021.1 hypothetical protein [Burkholderia multivorans]
MSLAAAKWNTDWTAEDKAAIKAALYRQFDTMHGPDAKGWFSTVDPDHVYRVICETTTFESALINGYLLSLAWDKPWWSPDKKLLHEQMVLKVDPAAWNFRSVIRVMVDLARLLKAAGVTSGTALAANDRKLARVYERFGFRTAAHSLYLEL